MDNVNLKYLQLSATQHTSEATLQKQIATFLDWKKHVWMHSPNEGKRSPRTGAHLKAQGMKGGFPDICIFDLKLVIELKTKYNKPTPLQAEWLERMRGLGWSAWWVNSFEEFEALYEDTINAITK